MKKCPVDNIELEPAYTKQGVEIDRCPNCKGVWLDGDEIYHFTKIPTYLKSKINQALKNMRPTSRRSPVTEEEMVEISVFDGDVQIDYCLKTEGMWFDQGEIEKFPIDKAKIEVDEKVGDIEQKKTVEETVKTGAIRAATSLFPLPNLFVSSVSVLFGMYAVLTLALIITVQFTELTPTFALISGLIFVFFQFVFGPFIMDLTFRFLYRVKWVPVSELPEHLQDFMTKLCHREGIKYPRMGLINDGSPQALTYGHHPNNARIVISQGLLDLLREEEVEAVVAHEIGHIVHWDMLIMTIAQIVPLVLYYIYRTLMRMRSSGREDKGAAVRYAVAIGAYILYIISEYIVLWFSRIREYYADRYAGQVTGQPSMLASALVKIGYGLAGEDPRNKEGKDSERSGMTTGLQTLGIFNQKEAGMLAISNSTSAKQMGGDIDKENLKEVAKWDLWNPWAMYYELHSTHPLIAKRIKMLSNLSVHLGKEPYIEFNEQKPESYWDDFFLDLAVHILPMLTFIFGTVIAVITMGRWTEQQITVSDTPLMESTMSDFMPFQQHAFDFSPIGWCLILFGASYLLKVLYSYPGKGFKSMKISSLLKKIKVSAVSSVPCHIKGTIIGRGVPGLIYSEDFVVQDETGMIFLDYHQPLMMVNFLFGLLRAAKYHNQEAEIIGWYRRAPVPYIEIREFKINNKVSKCYTYSMKLICAALCILGGVIMFLI